MVQNAIVQDTAHIGSACTQSDRVHFPTEYAFGPNAQSHAMQIQTGGTFARDAHPGTFEL